MSAALVLDAATERVAVNLLRHLEWQSEGFSLIFLFADVGPSMQLADWLDQRLATQGRPLQRHEAKDSFVREPEAEVDGFVAHFGELSVGLGGVWYAVQRHPSDTRWNRARSLFLARLNERRFLLERDLKRPLVLVLPAHFRPEARSIAPDIWHKRDLSEELRVVGSVGLSAGQATASVVALQPQASAAPLAAFAEWQRMQATVAPEQVFLPTAWAACSELLAAGRPADAEQVAQQALSLARRRADTAPDSTTFRDLSVSLNNVGQVAQAQGEWAQAESVYRESLDLSRQLVERLGGTPEALRDLSISLNNVGRVAQAQGEWAQAESVYRESLGLRRQLVERLGGTPESLDDQAVALINVAMAASRGEQAAPAEAVAIYRTLADRYPAVERYHEQLRALSGDNASPSDPDLSANP